MVLTVSFVLFPVIGLSCHRRQRDAKHHRRLDASVEASEPHDFIVRNSTLVLRAVASIASPAQRSVTIAKRPSGEQKTRGTCF
jgi:hypothetical protein